MDKGIKVFVGLDVHKDSISVEVAEAADGTGATRSALVREVSGAPIGGILRDTDRGIRWFQYLF